MTGRVGLAAKLRPRHPTAFAPADLIGKDATPGAAGEIGQRLPDARLLHAAHVCWQPDANQPLLAGVWLPGTAAPGGCGRMESLGALYMRREGSSGT